MNGPERLSRVAARLGDCDSEADPSAAGWASAVAIAEAWGLLTVSGPGDDPTLTRTVFGDAWAAQHDLSGRPLQEDQAWPPGPGRFALLSYPLTRRPLFPVLALTGPAVSEIRQGIWNVEYGFGRWVPNPVTDVEMHSSLLDGTGVTVQSAGRERFGFPALKLSDLAVYPEAAELLTTALNAGAEPWQIRPIEVDGTVVEACVLDLKSTALPAGVVGPALLAVFRVGTAEVTVIAENRKFELVFTEITPEDLLGADAGAGGVR